MQAGDIKTLLAALALPPALPLLLALLGLGLVLRRRRALGLLLALPSLAGLWALSCHAVAIAVAQFALPPAPVVPLPQVIAARPQAVVVLGGGVIQDAPEYGSAQPAANTLARLRYGIRLARAAQLPMAFSGGVGWAAMGTSSAPEAEVAQRVAKEEFGFDIRWVEAQSRDTAENAQRTAALLLPQGMRRVTLVTDAWHMPRAVLEFRRAGFEVIASPTGLMAPRDRAALEWLPSGQGLAASRQVLREWIALRAAELR